MTILFFIILILAIAAITSLFVLIIASQGRRDNRNRIFHAFSEAINEFRLSIAKSDVLGERMIALDKKKGLLLYLIPNSDYYDAIFVRLSEVNAYDIVHAYSVDFHKSSKINVSEKEVDSIKLRLYYKNDSKPVDLLFYDKNVDKKSDKIDRSQLAKEWRDTLSTFTANYGRVREINNIPKFKTYRDAA